LKIQKRKKDKRNGRRGWDQAGSISGSPEQDLRLKTKRSSTLYWGKRKEAKVLARAEPSTERIDSDKVAGNA